MIIPLVPAVLLAVSGSLLLGSTLSYFTDRTDTSVQGTAGSVRIQLIPDVDLTGSDGDGTLIPGDGRKVNFEIPNKGNKFIVQKIKANYTASDPLYKVSPTTSLSDSLMQCLISITLAAIRKCDATEG